MPFTPCAGYWGNANGDRAWMNAHATLVNKVKSNSGPLDILLVGDSITQHWGGGLDEKPFNAVWQKYFGQKKAATRILIWITRFRVIAPKIIHARFLTNRPQTPRRVA